MSTTPAALAQRQLDAYNAHDLDAFVACYAEDVVVLSGDEVAGRGRAFLRERYTAQFAARTCRADLLGRMEAGEWAVDHEHAVGTSRGEAVLMVAYRVRGGLIDRVVFMS
ncbi:nuclear transport factor 2 family protein [Nonomuraea longicatena]|uniref:Nuclear transport factor 2 family protein n=1 Tax=Nonomuraea longicatena TaxID=83682 RepID=A0ABP4B667_9ACTN